jgi:hypothetical protein
VVFQVGEELRRDKEILANIRVAGDAHKLVVNKPFCPSVHSLVDLIDKRER